MLDTRSLAPLPNHRAQNMKFNWAENQLWYSKNNNMCIHRSVTYGDKIATQKTSAYYDSSPDDDITHSFPFVVHVQQSQ